MTTPMVTIADALIEFILSLLRDPNAAAEFAASPDEALERGGLSDICGADVRAVVPVIVDHPDVMPRPPAPHHVAPQHVVPYTPKPPTVGDTPHTVVPKPPTVVEEISRVANNFHIDNRSTIVDQSINQSIWAEGDVMQVFDHEAILAIGDGSMAAGNDATVDSSTTDTTMGDVSMGNTETNTEITDSFNDESITADVDLTAAADDSFNDESTSVEVNTTIEDSFQNTETTVVDTDIMTATYEEPYDETISEEYSADVVDDYYEMDFDEV